MKEQQKENLYLKSKSHLYIIKKDNDVKHIEIKTSSTEAVLYLDLNLIDDFRKITYCHEYNQRLQDKLSYMVKILDILVIYISIGTLNEKNIDLFLQILLKEINYLIKMTQSKLKSKKRKNDIEILSIFMATLDDILKVHRNEYKNKKVIRSIKYALPTIKSIKEYISIMVNENIDKEIKSHLLSINKKYNSTNFKFLFNDILSKYSSLTLECYHASFEHELNQDDKINYPLSLHRKSLIDSFREKNTEYVDVTKMKKLLEIYGYRISTVEKNDANYYMIYQIYCIQTLNNIYDFFIDRHKYGKHLAVEKLYQNEESFKRTMASDLILDAMISGITLNKKDIKFEGLDIKQMLIAVSPKEKDKNLKIQFLMFATYYYLYLYLPTKV